MLNLQEYVALILFLLLGIAFITGLFLASFVFRERANNDPNSKMVYECGMPPMGTAFVSPNIRFYLFALIFVVFDVEAVFILPWAVQFKALGWAGFIAMGVFLLILTLGFIYEWKNGALKWE